jgi:hypothetical protein
MEYPGFWSWDSSGYGSSDQLHDDNDECTRNTPQCTEDDGYRSIGDVRTSDVRHEIKVIDEKEDKEPKDGIDNDFYDILQDENENNSNQESGDKKGQIKCHLCTNDLLFL